MAGSFRGLRVDGPVESLSGPLLEGLLGSSLVSGRRRGVVEPVAAPEVVVVAPLLREGRVGGEVESGYTRFAYSYAPSAEAAFAKEWRNYDDFGGSDGLDNAMPPSRPQAAHAEYLAQRI